MRRFGSHSLADSVCIGVGRTSAARNTRTVLEHRRDVQAVIVVGFAGGLVGSVGIGSIVVAENVSDAVTRADYRPDARLLCEAREIQMASAPVHFGGLVTIASVLVSAADKRKFATGTRAIAVDMESAGAAAAATEFGIPWLAVRVITDGLDDDLPLDFNALANADGSVDRSRIISEVLRHPSKIPGLIRLGRRSALSARHLALFLDGLLRRIELP